MKTPILLEEGSPTSAWSHLNWFTPAVTLLPRKVTFVGSGGKDFNIKPFFFFRGGSECVCHNSTHDSGTECTYGSLKFYLGMCYWESAFNKMQALRLRKLKLTREISAFTTWLLCEKVRLEHPLPVKANVLSAIPHSREAQRDSAGRPFWGAWPCLTESGQR